MEVVNLLLASGGDFNLVDNDEEQMEVVNLLLASGGDFNLVDNDEDTVGSVISCILLGQKLEIREDVYQLLRTILDADLDDLFNEIASAIREEVYRLLRTRHDADLEDLSNEIASAIHENVYQIESFLENLDDLCNEIVSAIHEDVYQIESFLQDADLVDLCNVIVFAIGGDVYQIKSVPPGVHRTRHDAENLSNALKDAFLASVEEKKLLRESMSHDSDRKDFGIDKRHIHIYGFEGSQYKPLLLEPNNFFWPTCQGVLVETAISIHAGNVRQETFRNVQKQLIDSSVSVWKLEEKQTGAADYYKKKKKGKVSSNNSLGVVEKGEKLNRGTKKMLNYLNQTTEMESIFSMSYSYHNCRQTVTEADPNKEPSEEPKRMIFIPESAVYYYE